MNLGQLIDPEWVQERLPRRFPPQAPQHPLEVLTHRDDGIVDRRLQNPPPPAPPPARAPVVVQARGTMKAEILGILKEGKLSSRELLERMGKHWNPGSVSGILSQLQALGWVRKEGARRPFRFVITDKGRERAG